MPLLTNDQLQTLDVLQRLHTCMDQLTKSQRVVADYFQEHTIEAAFSTVDKTAHHCGVSTTTVVRLANALGYSGYAELQGALKEYLTSASAPVNMFSSVIQTQSALEEGGDIEAMLELEIQNLRNTCAALSKTAVEQAAATLCGARQIFVIGGRNCEGPTRFFSYNIDRMFLNAQYISCDTTRMPEQLNHMTADDALVYFCFGRYLRSIGDATRFSKGIGAKVIGVTDSTLCPWAAFTDQLFICDKQSLNFHHSPLAMMFVANVLVKRCAQNDPQRVEANLQKLEQAVQTLQIFMKK